MAAPDQYRYLAQLLGARSENERLTEDLLQRIVSDYVHWRRNYFPGDEFLLTPSLRREFKEESERLTEVMDRALAALRRSFPFHSPRYIAHQQSETTLPSMLGMLAGMLYNTNSITPESGAVTVEWEIEACNALTRMLGLEPPPAPPDTSSAEALDQYAKALTRRFAWAHLTSGGTVANIEALWVARAVKYFPLAVREACARHGIELSVKLPDAKPDPLNNKALETTNIADVEPPSLLGLKPTETIYLLGRFVQAVEKAFDLDSVSASKRAIELLNEDKYAPRNGFFEAAAEYPPVILTTGAAHYSIEKAADILGLGRNAVWKVKMDSRFRMDPEDLKKKLKEAVRANKAVIAVIGMLGTTEEGAVDPLDEMIKARDWAEAKLKVSFWLHVDAAWGGFIRSLFDSKLSRQGMISALLFECMIARAGEEIGVVLKSDKTGHGGNLEEWMNSFAALVYVDTGQDGDRAQEVERVSKKLTHSLGAARSSGDWSSLKNHIAKLYQSWLDHGYGPSGSDEERRNPFKIMPEDKLREINNIVRDDILVHHGEFAETIRLEWPDAGVGRAFQAVPQADSVTIDPHKMGYTPYPCGAIVFRNDRVRHFVHQSAPYITRNDSVVHHPLRHLDLERSTHDEPHITTSAPGPYTLEGSRPGSAAASLWIASKALPFVREEHGQVVRASLLAARALYAWIENWKRIDAREQLNEPFELVPFCDTPPDTNIVAFGVKKRGDASLSGYNELNRRVYRHFSIQSELGEYRTSYAQPFFLSSTLITHRSYTYETVQDYMDRCGFNTRRGDYEADGSGGLRILRATVQNPYIWPTLKLRGQDLIREFLLSLTKAARTESNGP
jgi:glutamate/tyrosine decarboxylase-like PLP-dependent enzyme